MKERIPETQPKPIVINQMPSVEDLTDFLKHMNGGEIKVTFDIEKGVFVRLEDKQGK